MHDTLLTGTGAVTIFKQAYGDPFDLNTAQIAGIHNGKVTLLGGDAFKTGPNENSYFATNVTVVGLSDYSVQKKYSIYDHSDAAQQPGAWPQTLVSDVEITSGGSLLVGFKQFANDADYPSETEMVILSAPNAGKGAIVRDIPVDYDDFGHSSQALLQNLSDGQTLAVVQAGQRMIAQKFSAQGVAIGDEYFLTSHRLDPFHNFVPEDAFGPLTLQGSDRIIT